MKLKAINILANSISLILTFFSIQPVDALRGTIDRNRKTEKKELCQHIP
jgi:hypothetical protein